jgi:hypothetical protein
VVVGLVGVVGAVAARVESCSGVVAMTVDPRRVI